VAAALLEALETLQAVPVGHPGTPLQHLVFSDHVAWPQASGAQRLVHEGVAVDHGVLTLRLEGFLQAQLLRAGGLHKARTPPGGVDQHRRRGAAARPDGVERAQATHAPVTPAPKRRRRGWPWLSAARSSVRASPGRPSRLR
jgi:hypothetical protein